MRTSVQPLTMDQAMSVRGTVTSSYFISTFESGEWTHSFAGAQHLRMHVCVCAFGV